MSTAATIATLTSISTTCKNPELAMQFLNLINTDPVLYNMACFGIEGVHYTLNDNGDVYKRQDFTQTYETIAEKLKAQKDMKIGCLLYTSRCV